MRTLIEIHELKIEPEKLNKIKSDLEKLTETMPNKDIELTSRKLESSIDLRKIKLIQKYDAGISYHVEFYHVGNREQYLGYQQYTPEDLNK